MKLSLVDAGEPAAPRALAEWHGTPSRKERSQMRAIAEALTKDEEAADELETWLTLGHAALQAWACAERQVAELKEALARENPTRSSR